MKRFLLVAAACAALAACAKAPAPKSEFDYGVSLKDVMRGVMDQAAWAFWNRQGETTGPKGETISRLPPDPAKLTNEAEKEAAQKEWDVARASVVQLIELTNLIKLPGYQRTVEKNDNGDWIKYTNHLNDLTHQALAAVDAKDGDKMFTIGGDIFDACSACHQKYLLPFADPNTGSIPDGMSVSGKPLHK